MRFQALQEQSVVARFDELVAWMAAQNVDVSEAEVEADITEVLAELDD